MRWRGECYCGAADEGRSETPGEANEEEAEDESEDGGVRGIGRRGGEGVHFCYLYFFGGWGRAEGGCCWIGEG